MFYDVVGLSILQLCIFLKTWVKLLILWDALKLVFEILRGFPSWYNYGSNEFEVYLHM